MTIRWTVLLLALCWAAPSFATCSTAALAGKWTPRGSFCDINIDAAGRISGFCGGSMSGKLTLSASCGATGAINGQKVNGRTESIASTTAKPNLLAGYLVSRPGFFFFIRQPD